MMVPFKLKYLNVDAVLGFPDGDYTVGRGADPRSAAERAADPDGSIARRKLEAEQAATTGSKRKRAAPRRKSVPTAAE